MRFPSFLPSTSNREFITFGRIPTDDHYLTLMNHRVNVVVEEDGRGRSESRVNNGRIEIHAEVGIAWKTWIGFSRGNCDVEFKKNGATWNSTSEKIKFSTFRRFRHVAENMGIQNLKFSRKIMTRKSKESIFTSKMESCDVELRI